MQGSTTRLLVAAAVVGLTLSGCVVHNHPAPAAGQEPQPQAQQPSQPRAKAQAQVVQTPKPAPAPATRPAVAPAPTPAPSVQPAAAARSYTIKPGDNLWNISKEVYGDGTKYQRILDANPGINPDNMKPGTKIVIP